MPKQFSQFQANGVPNLGDFLVGYTNTNANGERRWSIDTIRKAIIGQTTAAPIQVQVAATVNRQDGTRRTPGLWYNVRSVTTDSAARKTINFTNPLPSNNYCVIANPVFGSDDACHYETRPVLKAADRVTIYHVNSTVNLGKEPAFDFIIVQ